MPTFFSDYIGCLISTGTISDFGNPNKRQGIRRKIKIENLKFKAIYEDTPPLTIYKHPHKDVQQDKTRNMFLLKTIMDQNPQSYKGVRFTTEATITGINMNKDWYYISCYQCGKAAVVREEDYSCLDHGPQPGPFFRRAEIAPAGLNLQEEKNNGLDVLFQMVCNPNLLESYLSSNRIVTARYVSWMDVVYAMEVSRKGYLEDTAGSKLDETLFQELWSSYTRFMIELRADVEFKDTIVVVVPQLVVKGDGKLGYDDDDLGFLDNISLDSRWLGMDVETRLNMLY
nr:hypothetical protein [Tanacetum cinerariifolium]